MRDFLGSLLVLSPADVAKDRGWLFVPFGVVSSAERDILNTLQIRAFAKEFGLPLFKWKRTIPGAAGQRLVRECDTNRLWAGEEALWSYFVEGAPVLITERFRVRFSSASGLGSDASLDSLLFGNRGVPAEVKAAYAQGGYVEVELRDPPFAVAVRVVLEDETESVQSLVEGAIIVPLFPNTTPVAHVMRSMYAALARVPLRVAHTGFPYMLGFALMPSDLRGKTLNRLVLSLGGESRPPWEPKFDRHSLYLMCSCVRSAVDLRILERLDEAEHDRLAALFDR